MIKKILAFILITVSLAGCSNAVKYTVSDQYRQARPYTIAIMPVVQDGQRENNEAARFFRTAAAEKLRLLNYGVIPLEQTDEKYQKAGSAWFSGKKPHEAAKLFNADAVLYIHVTGLDRSMFAGYASLKLKAFFEIYSLNGALLWRAEHHTRESDLSFDKKSIELSVIKAYEPQIQRFTDAVFATLPRGEAPIKTQTFFQWLP